MIRKLWRWAVSLIGLMIIVSSMVLASGSESKSMPEDSYKYIIKNLDNNFMNVPDIFTDSYECAYLRVKNTYVTDEVLETVNYNLDEYFALVHETGQMIGYILTSEIDIPLYDLDMQSDFIVGIIDTDLENPVCDYVFAENNYEGNELEDNYFDKETNLVYVKKDNLYKTTEGETLVNYVQIQCLRSDKQKSKIEISIDGEVFDEQEADILQNEIKISLSKNVSDEEIEVYINDISTPLAEDSYKIENSNIIIDSTSANISKINVDINDSLLDKAKSAINSIFGPTKTYALTTSESAVTSALGNWIGKAKVGDYVDFTAKGVNTEKGAGRDYIQTVAGSAPNQDKFYDSIINHSGDDAEEYVYGTYSGTKKNVYKSTYNATYGINMNTKSVKSSNNEYMKKWVNGIDSIIQMSCIEVNKAVYQDFGKNSTLNFTVIVSGIGDDYIALSFCSKEKTSSGSSNQVLCGTYAVSYNPETIEIDYNLNGGKWETDNHKTKENVVLGDIVEVQTLKIKDEPRKEGYAFCGWSDKKEGTTNYIGGEKIDTIDFTDGSRPLYAVWKKANDNLTFWSEYLSELLFSEEDVYVNNPVKIPIPSHFRYSFTGYYLITGYEDNNPVIGEKLIDSKGNFVLSEYESIIKGGQYINKEEIRLYAMFDDE